MEKLMILNEDGTPSGRLIERTEAHRIGALHATSQIFMLRKKEGKTQVLLQKRSADKDSFPNCWDMSCAGHVVAGMDYLEGAKKELAEELGIDVKEKDLIPLFMHRTEIRDEFYGEPFIDRQYSQVYLLVKDVPEDEICFQKEEISAVRWVDASDLLEGLQNGATGYCISTEKLEKALKMSQQYL